MIASARKGLIFATILLLFLLGTNAQAIENGFAVWGGVSSLEIENLEISSPEGGSVGVDYQIVLSDIFSVNPFFMYTSNNASIKTVFGSFNFTLTTLSLGGEGRFWMGDFFYLALNAAAYNLELTFDEGGSSTSNSGTGFGFGLGIETDSGFLVKTGFDQVDIDGDTNSWARLLVGWRF